MELKGSKEILEKLKWWSVVKNWRKMIIHVKAMLNYIF